MSQAKLLSIRALTPLHPGSGTGVGVIDTPIQRERYTGFPLIPGSSIKGVLKFVYTGEYKDIIFGAEKADAGDYASSASFSDARIFAYPVRSLKGVFAWVICPEVLRRLKSDLSSIGTPPNFDIPEVTDAQIICFDSLKINKSVVLEEYDFKVKNGKENNLKAIIEFGKKFFSDDADKNAFAGRLAIISDNDYAHFARYSTEVVARIALEKGTKKAKDGALFYQEFIPPEALFYSIIRFENFRENGKETEEIAKEFSDNLKPILQLGGDETIGKGICEVKLN